MKRLILLVVVLAGVGIWRGWFTINSEPSAPGSTQQKYEFSINRDRIQADEAALQKDVSDLATKPTEPAK